MKLALCVSGLIVVNCCPKYVIMKLFSLLTLCLSFLTFNSNAQNCGGHVADREGAINVNISSAEVGECFKFFIKGDQITPDLCNNLIFKTNADAILKIKVVMENGTEFTKNMPFSPDQKSVLYNIKKNKKGKYSLKMKLGATQLTDEAVAQNQADMKAREEERKRKQAESDAEWDAKREASKQRMKENMANHEGAKLSEYEDTRQGREGMKVEGKQGQQIEGRQGQQIEGRQGQKIEGRQGQQIEGRQGQQIEGKKGQEIPAAPANPYSTDKPANPYGTDKPDAPANPYGNSSFGSGNSGSAFDNKDEDMDGGHHNIINPKGETVKVPLRLLYERKPVAGVHLTLEINKIKLGSGTTDEDGYLTITTNKPVDTESAYKLYGKKGDVSWSFGGMFLLHIPPKLTNVYMSEVIKEVSSQMDISESTLSRSWGFVMGQ